MKITKRQLKRIIREEKVKLLSEQPANAPTRDMGPGSMTPMSEIIARLEDALISVGLDMIMAGNASAQFENDVIGFVMDTSTSDEGEVEAAMQELAERLNMIGMNHN